MTSISDSPGGSGTPSVLTVAGMSENSSSTLAIPNLFSILSSDMVLGHYRAKRIVLCSRK